MQNIPNENNIKEICINKVTNGPKEIDVSDAVNSNSQVKGTVHPQHKCPLCKSPSLAYLRMAIHSPQLSFVTEILDFVSLNFAHIIAAIFVELGGGIACTFERFDVIV